MKKEQITHVVVHQPRDLENPLDQYVFFSHPKVKGWETHTGSRMILTTLTDVLLCQGRVGADDLALFFAKFLCKKVEDLLIAHILIQG
jgi:hypothetical protein